MKQIIILAFFFTAISCKAQKQAQKDNKMNDRSYKPLASFNKDTVAYLVYNFIDHKEKYINKPFSTLMGDLEFPIISYVSSIVASNRYISPDITIFSYDNNNRYVRKALGLKPFNLIITWVVPVPNTIADSLCIKNKNYWKKDEMDFFKNQIVKNVSMSKYNHPEHYYD